jgi:hypothetical protein
MAKRSSLRLGSYPKLAVRYCGSFQLLENRDPIAYMLALPAYMRIHNVLHVSLLNKYMYDLNHIIYWDMIQVEHEGEFPGGTSAHLRLKIQSAQK